MKLINEWRSAHKFASVRLAALVGLVASYFAAYPDQFEAVMAQVPESLRPLLGFVLFAVATGARVVKKGDADRA